jgi:predicted small secreted protein
MPKILYLLILPFLFTSCNTIDEFGADSKDSTGNYVAYKAKKIISFSEVNNIGFDTIQPIKNIGQVIATEKYLLIGELKKGIHIFDNRNPSKPVNSFFINIPANTDFILKDNFIIADNGTDLISINAKIIEEVIDKSRRVIDLKRQNTSSIFEVFRVRSKQFRFPQFPIERNIFYDCRDTTKGFVIEWEKTNLKDLPNCYR